MSFKLIVETPDGNEVVHEIDDLRVRKVSFGTRNGGSGTIGIAPNVTEVVVSFETAAPHEIFVEDLDNMKNSMNLTEEDVEALTQELADRGKIVTNDGTDFFTPEAMEARAKLEEELTVPGGGGQREDQKEAEFDLADDEEKSSKSAKSKAKSNA